MPIVLPKPKSVTGDEVVLARADWEQLVLDIENSDIDEDADDIAAVAAARAEDAAFAARLEAERGCAVETTIPLEVVEAEFGGIHPLRAWREHRGWTRSDLSLKSGVTRDMVDRIEERSVQGGTGPLLRLAQALAIPMEFLLEEAMKKCRAKPQIENAGQRKILVDEAMIGPVTVVNQKGEAR